MRNFHLFGSLLFLLGFSVFGCTAALAQFSGSLSTGIQTSTNIQAVDTSSPDNILLPALQLNYDWQASGTSRLGFSAGYAPNFYSTNTSFSYNELSFGITGQFFLNHLDDITKQVRESGAAVAPAIVHNSTQGGSTSDATTVGGTAEASNSDAADSSDNGDDNSGSRNDTLVQIAVADLYALSGQLDSADLLSKGISKALAASLSHLKDSISDVISTDADLFDSVGYDESTKEIILPELQHLKFPFGRLEGHLPTWVHTNLVDSAIAVLQAAVPTSDLVATPVTPAIPNLPASAVSQLASVARRTVAKASSEDDEEPTKAPSLTLINSSTRLRDLSSSDVSLLDDVADSDATTLATSLSIPLNYTLHTGRNAANRADTLLFGIGSNGVTGNPNDAKTFSAGIGIDAVTSSAFGLRGSYDYTNSSYPYDSVYTNSENRFRLGARVGITDHLIGFAEYSIGLRKYLDPLTANGKAVLANFSQNTYGAGLSLLIGERALFGALASFNQNPNLRGYVTDLSVSRRVRLAVQVADDEFTYDLSRFAFFSNIRFPGEVDLGADLGIEHRQYGSVTRNTLKGGTVTISKGRTENGTYPTVNVSKMWPMENRLFGAFQSFTLSGTLAYSTVNSSDAAYSYNATEVTFNGSLGF